MTIVVNTGRRMATPLRPPAMALPRGAGLPAPGGVFVV
jgi:hypothetical protein